MTFTLIAPVTFTSSGKISGSKQISGSISNQLTGTGDAGLRLLDGGGNSIIVLDVPTPFSFPLPPGPCLLGFGCFESTFSLTGKLDAGTYTLDLFTTAGASAASIGLPGIATGSGSGGFDVSFATAAVLEPGTWALACFGLLMLVVTLRRQSSASRSGRI